jgi:hypothetical protein
LVSLAKPPVIEDRGSISHAFPVGTPSQFARLKVIQIP